MMITLLLLTLFLILHLSFHYSFHKWRYHSMSKIITKTQTSDVDMIESKQSVSLTDLPDSILDIILQKLSAKELCRMGVVSAFLMEKCISDHLWDIHMKSKWSKIIGRAAYDQDWHKKLSHTSKDRIPDKTRKSLVHFIKQNMSFHSKTVPRNVTLRCPLSADSVASRYIALENGTFWFSAQIYNRQNGHVGYLLSAYDAKLCYDRRTDTFQARYPAYDTLDIPLEKNVTWDRIRAKVDNISPYDVFASESLITLRPDDHIEIQWRRNKQLPYGWWYGVIGHLDQCDQNRANCHCTNSDILVLEFRQYSLESRWRKTLIDRRDCVEKGDEDVGFYGGVRKVESCEEMSTWLRIWSTQVHESV